MKKFSYISVFLLTFLGILVTPVAAQNKPKTVIKLPAFFAGDNQTIDKPVDSDVMAAGGQVTLSTTVTGDVYVAGGQISIGGTINGNLIVAGGDIKITGNIDKNLIVAGGQVAVEDQAVVNGYVLAGGGKVDLLGKILGPVKVGAGSLTVGDKASIGGNLEADVSKSDIALGATISGEKKVKIYETASREPVRVPANLWRNMGIAGGILIFISKLVVLLVLVKLFGTVINQAKLKSFWTTMGWGLVVLSVTPFLFVLLLATIIGIPLGIIILAIYFVCLYLSVIVASLVAGKLMDQRGWLNTKNLYLQGSVGLVLITILEFIPLVGGLIRLIVLLTGLGVLFGLMTVKNQANK